MNIKDTEKENIEIILLPKDYSRGWIVFKTFQRESQKLLKSYTC